MIGVALDSLPITSVHRKIVALIAAGIFVDAFDVYMAAGVIASLVSTKFATLGQTSLFVSITFLGFFVGAILSGYLGDIIGRKAVYQLNLLIFGICSVAAFFAPNMTWLIVLRGLMGLGLGAELVVGYATLHEFIPPNTRGRWVGLVTTLSASTALVSAVVAYFVIPTIGWRYMFLIVGIPSLIVWLMRWNLPESPRWLESKGRTDEALQIAEKIGMGHLKLENVSRAVEQETRKFGFKDLFQGKVGVTVLVATIVNITMTVTLYTVTSWIPTLLVKNGFTLTKSLGFVALIDIGSIVGAILATYLSDSIGRRATIGIFAFLGAVFAILFALSHSVAMLLIFGFVTLLCIYVLTAMVYGIYVPELFPTDVRLSGTGLSNSIGRLANVFVPLLVPSLVRLYGTMGVFGAAAIAMLVMVLAVVLHKTENRKKPLELINMELQA